MLKPLFALSFLIAAAAPASALLTPEQLTPAEKKVYGGLIATPATARKYLVTREYLRLCDAVIADPKTAIALPVQPPTFSERYLSMEERARVDQAVDLNIMALLSGGRLA